LNTSLVSYFTKEDSKHSGCGGAKTKGTAKKTNVISQNTPRKTNTSLLLACLLFFRTKPNETIKGSEEKRLSIKLITLRDKTLIS